MNTSIVTNRVWRDKLAQLSEDPHFISEPRGMKVHETLSGFYRVPMPAYITLKSRKVNYAFMFGEAYWILSGSNLVSNITRFMKSYKNYSDNGVFLGGAYGPKVVDQLSYVVKALRSDPDTRQAILNIWRERPGSNKDIPCTLSLQFLIRKGRLHTIATMRSNDIVKGFTYDVFTFSMISLAVILLLQETNQDTTEYYDLQLGSLFVNAGSLHLYESDMMNKNFINWMQTDAVTTKVDRRVEHIMKSQTYDDLLANLEGHAIQLILEKKK